MTLPEEFDKNSDSKRVGARFNVEQDIVIHHKGVKYPSKLKNISITGVSASVTGYYPETIQVGDICGLSFNADPSVKPEVYSSSVTRIDSSGIALNFIGFIL